MSAGIASRGLLFALPGAAGPEARTTLSRIGRAASLRFPGVDQRWAYTSRGLRRKLAAQGQSAESPEEALDALRAAGARRVAVLPLHMSDGMEFGELAATVAVQAGDGRAFEKISLGTPLLVCAPDFQRVAAALLAGLPPPVGEHEGVVLVAHGSRDPRGATTFAAAAALCRGLDRRLYLGVMLGAPSRDDVLGQCKADGLRQVRLLPLTATAGRSAREDLAGDGEQSWKTAFERKGIQAVPVLRGLGDYDGVVDVWLDQAGRLLKDLDRTG